MRETLKQRHAVLEEITLALGDTVAWKSQPWWQYFFVVSALGPEGVRELVAEVRVIEDQGGMTTSDGTRRRTPGGVFFVLAKKRLGAERMNALRSQAERYFQERMLKRFLRLMVLVSPAAQAPIAIPGTKRARSPRPRAESPKKQAGRDAGRPGRPPARAASGPSKGAPPERRQEPVVEVIRVRRRSP